MSGASLHRGSQPCTRCGKAKHPIPEKCPAKSATCHKCNRKGHYASQCLSKTVAASAHEVEADSEEEVFLGTVTSDKETAWTVNIQLQGKEVLFKLDTGAEVTVISEEVYHTLKRAKLEKPSKVLYGPAQQCLEVVGQFAGSLKHGEHSYTGNIFVVQQL